MLKLSSIPKIVFLFLSFAPTAAVYAQLSDTAFVQQAVNRTVRQYQEKIKGQTILFCGSEYPDPLLGEEEHPFFPADDWVYGSVMYHTQRYENVPLLYDANIDRLITENYYNAEEIVLMPEHVDEFQIGKHRFINMSYVPTSGLPTAGFYELIYGGETRVMAKRIKILSDYLENQRVHYKYDTKQKFFLLKNGVYFQVNSKRALLKVLSDQKNAIRQRFKEQRIIFNHDPVAALANIAEYYDELTSSN